MAGGRAAVTLGWQEEQHKVALLEVDQCLQLSTRGWQPTAPPTAFLGWTRAGGELNSTRLIHYMITKVRGEWGEQEEQGRPELFCGTTFRVFAGEVE